MCLQTNVIFRQIIYFIILWQTFHVGNAKFPFFSQIIMWDNLVDSSTMRVNSHGDAWDFYIINQIYF
jgi:hypothetical protein